MFQPSEEAESVARATGHNIAASFGACAVVWGKESGEHSEKCNCISAAVAYAMGSLPPPLNRAPSGTSLEKAMRFLEDYQLRAPALNERARDEMARLLDHAAEQVSQKAA